MPDELTPVTRLEGFLNGYDIEPVTRLEAILAGQDIDPVTRLEYFLKKAASGGGSGELEMESGLLQLSEETNRPEIAFAKAHSRCPDFYIVGIKDSEPESNMVRYTVTYTFYVNFEHLFGVIYTKEVPCYGWYHTYYLNSAGTSPGSEGSTLQYPTSDPASSGTKYSRYYVSETGLRPFAQSARFKTTYTYKWYAFWLP